MIEIETERLFIRPVELTEAADVVSIISESSSRWTSQIPWPYQLSDAKEWITSNQPWARLGIYLEGKLIGTTRMPISDDDEIGFVIADEYRGKGYATEAVGEIIDYAFINFALDHISSSAHPENAVSLRVHEKLGFKVLKETTHFWPNKGHDMPVLLLRLGRE